jgi:hypothetical protein
LIDIPSTLSDWPDYTKGGLDGQLRRLATSCVLLARRRTIRTILHAGLHCILIRESQPHRFRCEQLLPLPPSQLPLRMQPLPRAEDLFFALSEKDGPPPQTDYIGCRPHLRAEEAIDNVGTGLFTPESAPLESGLAIADAIPSLPPNPTLLSTIPSPVHDDVHRDISTATITGVNNLSFPTPPMEKPPPSFRLPSFELLGIAAPNPYNLSPSSNPSDLRPGVEPPSQPHDRHTVSRPLKISLPNIGDPSPLSDPAWPSPSHKAVHHAVLTHTPPDDRGPIDWGLPRVTTATGTESDEPAPTDDVTLTGDNLAQLLTPMSLGSDSNSANLPLCSGAMPWLGQALPIIRKGPLDLTSILSC